MPSRKNETFSHAPTPSKNPDLSPLNCSLFVELRKNPPNSLPELVKTLERYAASLNKDRIITAVNDILPRAQACTESDEGAFEYELKSFKMLMLIIYCGYVFLKCPTLGNTNNIIIT